MPAWDIGIRWRQAHRRGLGFQGIALRQRCAAAGQQKNERQSDEAGNVHGLIQPQNAAGGNLDFSPDGVRRTKE
jgi:hypothetical protein